MCPHNLHCLCLCDDVTCSLGEGPGKESIITEADLQEVGASEHFGSFFYSNGEDCDGSN